MGKRNSSKDKKKKGKKGLTMFSSIQLSPEGEVNSGGYIPRREADPEGDSYFSVLVFTKSDG